MKDSLRSLVSSLDRRVATAPDPEGVAEAQRLRGHISEFLLPRASDLDAPLLVVILGSTGSGKSSLFNALAGEPISDVGVLRPTTRVAQVLTRPDQPLPQAVTNLENEGLARLIRRDSARDHLVLVDSPDLDSIEADNRVLARRLSEAADLVVFVTTDTRYADEVPWALLRRARERGAPILTVINRLPVDAADRTAVLDDYVRLLAEQEVDPLELDAGTGLTGVQVGEIDPSSDALLPSAVEPVKRALERLIDDDEKRREVMKRSFDAALADLPDRVGDILQRLEVEVEARNGLLEIARDNYAHHGEEIGGQIDRGSFLRSEVLREWQDFVGAGQVARVVSEGVGKIATTIRSLFRSGPAVEAREVRRAALSDLRSLVASETAQAAAETAATWSRRQFGDEAIAANPELWGASPLLEERLDEALAAWAAQISTEIMEIGEQRRGLAKAASLGVNVVGTGAILAVFAHTGGLTGAEAGIAAATALLNQTLLEAIFGEASVARFVADARGRLDGLLDGLLTEDRSRFEAALPIAAESTDLMETLRSTLNSFTR